MANIFSHFVLRLLVEQLERVDLSVLETEAKLAFWINIYNALIMHVIVEYFQVMPLAYICFISYVIISAI